MKTAGEQVVLFHLLSALGVWDKQSFEQQIVSSALGFGSVPLKEKYLSQSGCYLAA